MRMLDESEGAADEVGGPARLGAHAVEQRHGFDHHLRPAHAVLLQGVRTIPVQTSEGCAQSRSRCGQGASSPGTAVAALSPVPAMM